MALVGAPRVVALVEISLDRVDNGLFLLGVFNVFVNREHPGLERRPDWAVLSSKNLWYLAALVVHSFIVVRFFSRTFDRRSGGRKLLRKAMHIRLRTLMCTVYSMVATMASV